MRAARFIARNLKFKGKMAVVSIAISFLIMIVALAVSSGFRHEIRRGISGISGDIQLMSPQMDYVSEENPVGESQSYMAQIMEVPGVQSVSPVIYRAGIVRSGEDIQGVMFKGTERDDTTRLGVSIPSKLARMLSLEAGDDLLTYFIGERVKARKFRITDIYPSILDSGDDLVIYASISDLRRLNGWEEGECSVLEILLDDAHKDKISMATATDMAGTIALLSASEDDDSLTAVSAMNKYPQIFSWLDLIDFNVLIILLLMTVVAGFNMISGLLIMLFRSISTIGTLKAMGMTDRSISSVFLRVASDAVLKGMLIGNIAAIVLCLLQKWTHLIHLNPENYFVSFVPIHLNFPLIIVADAISYGLIMLLLLIPTLFISRVDPAQTVRAQ